MIQVQTPAEKKLHEQINELHKQISDIKSRRTIQCPECKKRSPISSLIVIDHMSYDGWDWEFDDNMSWFCPKCGTQHQARKSDYYPEKQAMFNFLRAHTSYFSEYYHQSVEKTLDELRAKAKQ